VLLSGVVQCWRGHPCYSFLACLLDWYRRHSYSSGWVMARLVGCLYCFSLCRRLGVPRWSASTFGCYQHTTMTNPQAPLPCDWNKEDSTWCPYLNCPWLPLSSACTKLSRHSPFCGSSCGLAKCSSLLQFDFDWLSLWRELLIFLANMCFEPPSQQPLALYGTTTDDWSDEKYMTHQVV
jgi:hypothetical protein